MSKICSHCKENKTRLLCDKCSYDKMKEILFESGVNVSTLIEKFPNYQRNTFAEQLKSLQLREKLKTQTNENEKSWIIKRNNNLLQILKNLKDHSEKMKQDIFALEEAKLLIEKEVKNIRSIKEIKKKQRDDLEKLKLNHLRQIYSLHHIFPQLQVPLRLRIMQDKFYEATQTSVTESNKYFLDLPGLSSLIGLSEKHASIVSEMLCRIADIIIYISELNFVNLPVRMGKSEGIYTLSFYNDLSKIYELSIDSHTKEANFIEAVSLLFTNFLYLCRIQGIKLHIPINKDNTGVNDILNMNVILDQLTGNEELKEKNDETENSEFNLDVIDLRKRSNSLENEFEIIDDSDIE